MQIGRHGRPDGRQVILGVRMVLRLVPIVRAALSRRRFPINVGRESPTHAAVRSALVPAMPKPKPSRRLPKDKRAVRSKDAGSDQDQAANAITIAWTASVTAVFLADLATIAAHFFSRSHPDAKTAPVFAAIMLLTACLMGMASLALLIVVWRVQRLKPPQGFIVFAALVAAAPILATIVRLTTP
jgi:hypothetical protein